MSALRGDAFTARWPAFGSTAVLRVAEAGRLADAREAVEDEVARIDASCSRFREDSELSALNAGAGQPMSVSPLLFEALQLALRARELTRGDVDPTVGRALELLGYDRDWRVMDAAAPPAPAVEVRVGTGGAPVSLDPPTRSVRVPAGVVLDLGATAKAWAADRAAAAAAAAAGCGVLVGFGGDLAIAGTPPGDGYAVRVTADHRASADAPGQTVTLACGGLATSSTAVRSRRDGDRVIDHIVDPATGRSARSCWRTVSVAAASCADANIAATASIVRGTDAVPWLSSLELPARLVDERGGVTLVAGWPSPLPEPVPA